MSSWIRPTLITCVLLTSLGSVGETPASDDPPAGEAAAKKVALEFIKAYQGRDLDALVKVSSVPWMYDFTFTYKTEKELKDEFKIYVKPSTKLTKFPDTIAFINAYPDFRAKIGQAYYRKWLDDLLTKDDYVVAFPRKSEPNAHLYIFVRIKDKKATVAGYGGD